MTDDESKSPRKLYIALKAVLALFLALAAAFACGAIWYGFPYPKLNVWAMGLFIVLLAAAAYALKVWWHKALSCAVLIAAVIAWHCSVQPMQFRNWQADTTLLPHAYVVGSRVNIYQVRNYERKENGEVAPHYEMRKMDMSRLQGMDVFIFSYKGSPVMHPILSFNFGASGRLCFSIEPRLEVGESYAYLPGLFRQYELAYVVAAERDVINLRSQDMKGVEVHLYHLNTEAAQEVFLEYLRIINDLFQKPQWYNSFVDTVYPEISERVGSSASKKWSWLMLALKGGDRLLYYRRIIDRSLKYDKLRELSCITDRITNLPHDAVFSDKIRYGLPGMK